MQNSRTIEKLNLMDDFLFQEVISDAENGKEAVRLMLSVIMQKEIGEISVRTQNVITAGNTQRHAIRLDVYLEEGDSRLPDTVYDIEMQKEDTKELPQRSRYYQALIDARLLKRNMDYKTLKKLVIVLISREDIFGLNRMLYTFENRCVEVPELSLGDGAKKIFLYTKGETGNREELKELLNYIEESIDKNANSETIRRLHMIVSRIKNNEEVGVRYMKAIEYENMIRERAEAEGWEAGLARGRAEGIDQGRAEGRAEGRVKGNEEGKAEGKVEGETKKLISSVCKKIKKGKSVAEAAGELEEEEKGIALIYNIASEYHPDYETDKIYEEWKMRQSL